MKTIFFLRIGALWLVAVFVAGLVCPAIAQTPSNSSFEADIWSPGIQTLVGAGAVNSWTYNANGSSGLGVLESTPYGPTPFATKFVVLNGSGANHAYLEQTISGFTPGWVYRLAFSTASQAGGLGNTPPASRPLSRIAVTFTGATNTGAAIVTADRRGPGVWDTWICQELLFEATASSITIRFQHVDPSPLFANNGVGLDNVSLCNVTAGPCPANACQPFPPAPFPIQCGMAAATMYSGFDINIGVIQTNPVLAAVDLRDPKLNSMLGQNWFSPMFNNLNGTAQHRWTASNLGQVFGVTLDDASPPNIYVTATTLYNGVQPGGPSGPGAVYKINGTSGNISEFAVLNNGIMSNPKSLRVGPALGNICFDTITKKFFVSDLEDGNIYVLNLAGNIVFTYDHGVTGRPPQGYSVIADDGSIGAMTQVDRRTWGVHVDSGRLYYSVGTDKTNDIWSAYLLPSGQPASGSTVREFGVPPFGTPFPSPTITSIDMACNRMLLAERSTGMLGPHTSRILEYKKITGLWTLIQTYNTSTFPFSPSAAGGGDIAGDGTFWVTSDRLIVTNPPPGLCYGLLNLSPLNYNPNDPPGGGYNIDLNGILTGYDKNGIGDVELYKCWCMGIGAENVICTNGVFVWSFNVTNNSSYTWNSLAMTNLPVGITLSPISPMPFTPPLPPGGTRSLQWPFTAPGYAVTTINYLLQGLPASGPEICELTHCLTLPEACCPNIVVTNYIKCLTNSAATNQWYLTITNSLGTNLTGLTIYPFGNCIGLPAGNFVTLTNFPSGAVSNFVFPITVATNCSTNLCFSIGILGPQTNYLCNLTHCVGCPCVVSNRCPTIIIPPLLGAPVCTAPFTTSFSVVAEDADLDPLEVTWFTNGVAFATSTMNSGETNHSPNITFAKATAVGAVGIWDRKCPPIYWQFAIAVGDFEPPILTASTQLLVYSDLSVPAPDFTSLVNVSDNCTPSNQIVLTQFFAPPGSTITPGVRNIYVRATDASSNSTTIRFLMKVGDISLDVNPSGDLQTNSGVSLHTFNQPTNLTLTALGSLTNSDTVEFFVSGSAVGIATNPPFAVNWTPPAGGFFDAWAIAHRTPSLVVTSSHSYLAVVVRPQLAISLNNSNKPMLTWSNADYLLMSAPAVGGGWTDVTNSASPHAVEPTNSQRLFRLRSQ